MAAATASAILPPSSALISSLTDCLPHAGNNIAEFFFHRQFPRPLRVHRSSARCSYGDNATDSNAVATTAFPLNGSALSVSNSVSLCFCVLEFVSVASLVSYQGNYGRIVSFAWYWRETSDYFRHWNGCMLIENIGGWYVSRLGEKICSLDGIRTCFAWFDHVRTVLSECESIPISTVVDIN